MSRRNETVRVVRVHYDCDALNCAGEMLPTGSARMTSPRYEHVCNVCGARQDLSVFYPHIDYVVEKP